MEQPGGDEQKKKIKPQPPVWSTKAWKPFFPVDKETFDKMKSGDMETTCLTCKKPFPNFYCIFLHWKRGNCKKSDLPHVSPSSDMVVVIRNEGQKIR